MKRTLTIAAITATLLAGLWPALSAHVRNAITYPIYASRPLRGFSSADCSLESCNSTGGFGETCIDKPTSIWVCDAATGTFAELLPGGGGGDVSGPGSSVDNEIARFQNATGKNIQNTPTNAPQISDVGVVEINESLAINAPQDVPNPVAGPTVQSIISPGPFCAIANQPIRFYVTWSNAAGETMVSPASSDYNPTGPTGDLVYVRRPLPPPEATGWSAWFSDNADGHAVILGCNNGSEVNEDIGQWRTSCTCLRTGSDSPPGSNGTATGAVTIVDSSGGTFTRPTDNTVEVCDEAGCDYRDVQSALDSITDSSATNRYTVLVHPADYPSDVYFDKSYVRIRGMEASTTRIVGDLILKAEIVESGIQDLTVRRITGDGDNASDNWFFIDGCIVGAHDGTLGASNPDNAFRMRVGTTTSDNWSIFARNSTFRADQSVIAQGPGGQWVGIGNRCEIIGSDPSLADGHCHIGNSPGNARITEIGLSIFMEYDRINGEMYGFLVENRQGSPVADGWVRCIGCDIDLTATHASRNLLSNACLAFNEVGAPANGLRVDMIDTRCRVHQVSASGTSTGYRILATDADRANWSFNITGGSIVTTGGATQTDILNNESTAGFVFNVAGVVHSGIYSGGGTVTAGDMAIGKFSKSLEIPNQAGVCVAAECDADAEQGRICVDNSATTGRRTFVCEGAANGWVEIAGTSSGNSLDQAYDQGGAAAGRSIEIASASGAAVRIFGTAAGANEVLELESSPANGAPGDLVRILGRHADTGGAVTVTGRINFIQSVATPGAQSGIITFNAKNAGILAETFRSSELGNLIIGRPIDETRQISFNRLTQDGVFSYNGTNFATSDPFTDGSLPSQVAYEDEANTFASSGTQRFTDPIQLEVGNDLVMEDTDGTNTVQFGTQNRTTNITLDWNVATIAECFGLGNNGKLTIDASGFIGCAADISGGADGVGYDEVMDEGGGLTKRAQVNFIGAGVSCVDNGGSTRTDCTITGAGGPAAAVQVSDAALTTRGDVRIPTATDGFFWYDSQERNACYGASDGDALAGDSASSFFDAGTLEDVRLPTELAYEDEANTFASAGSQVFNDPVDLLPDGANGAQMSAGGLLAPTGTGNVQASQYIGSGSTSNEVDLATAEAAGVLPASKVDTAIARLAGPVFTGDAQAVTPGADDGDTSVATSLFVQNEHAESAGGCTNQFVTDVNADAVPTCAGVTNAETTANTMRGEEIEDAYCGANMAEVAGDCDLDVEIATRVKSFNIFDPATGDSDKIQWSIADPITIVKVWCSTNVATSTVTLMPDERAEATPNTQGTDVLSAGLVCDTDSQSSCASGCAVNTITNGSIDAYDPVSWDIDALGGATATVVRVHVEFTVND
jgi:hypothetical protein